MELERLSFLSCGPDESILRESLSLSFLASSFGSDDEADESGLPGISQVFSKAEIGAAVGMIVDHLRAIQQSLRTAHAFHLLRRVRRLVAFLKQRARAAVAARRRSVAALLDHFDDRIREAQRRPRGGGRELGSFRVPGPASLPSATTSPDGKTEKLTSVRSFIGTGFGQLPASSPTRSPARDKPSSPSPSSPLVSLHEVQPCLAWQWVDVSARVPLWDHASTLSLPSVRQRACEALYHAFLRLFRCARCEWDRQHAQWAAQQREEVPGFDQLYTRAHCHAALGRPYFTNCVGRWGQEDAPRRKALYDSYLHHARTRPKFQLDPCAAFLIPTDAINDVLQLLGEAQQPNCSLAESCDSPPRLTQAALSRLPTCRTMSRLDRSRTPLDYLTFCLRQECHREAAEVQGAIQTWRTQMLAQLAQDEAEMTRREQQLANDAVSPRLFNAALGSRRNLLAAAAGDGSPRPSLARGSCYALGLLAASASPSSLQLPRLAPVSRRSIGGSASPRGSMASDHGLLSSRASFSTDILNQQHLNDDSPRWKARHPSTHSAHAQPSLDLSRYSPTRCSPRPQPLSVTEPLVFHVTSPDLGAGVLLSPKSVRRRAAQRKQKALEPPVAVELHHPLPSDTLSRLNSSPKRGSFAPMLSPIAQGPPVTRCRSLTDRSLRTPSGSFRR
eukprot:EG_transcript_3640